MRLKRKQERSRVMTCTTNVLLWLWDSRVFANKILPACFHCQRREYFLNKINNFIIEHTDGLLAHDDDCCLCFSLNRRFESRKKLFELNEHKTPIRGGGFNEVMSERDWNRSLIACRWKKKFLREGHVGFSMPASLNHELASRAMLPSGIFMKNDDVRNARSMIYAFDYEFDFGCGFCAFFRLIFMHYVIRFCSNNSLSTHLQIIRRQMLSGHQVDGLQVELGTDGFSGHLNGAAWGGTFEWNRTLAIVNRIPITWNLPGV